MTILPFLPLLRDKRLKSYFRMNDLLSAQYEGASIPLKAKLAGAHSLTKKKKKRHLGVLPGWDGHCMFACFTDNKHQEVQPHLQQGKGAACQKSQSRPALCIHLCCHLKCNKLLCELILPLKWQFWIEDWK